jgi:HD-like signal output (HDOD) protein
MDIEKRISLLKKHTDTLAPLPTTVNKVLEVCQRADPSPGDLNRIISLDPVLVGKVLKLVNSAYYGLRQEITSLVHAIIMLGINTVKNLVLSTAILNKYKSKKHFKVLDSYGFWRHSLGVGVTSKLIAKKRNVVANRLEEFFISGLLHDIGKIPQNSLFPDLYQEVLHQSQTHEQPLYLVENQLIGFSHAYCGQLVTEHWQLGAAIVEACSHHHDLDAYSGKYKEVIYTVALANFYVNDSGMGHAGNQYPQEIDEKITDSLKFGPDELAMHQEEITAEVKNAEAFLNVVHERR